MGSRQNIQGSEWANAGAVTDPGGAKQDLGWVAEKPAYQSANFVENRQDEMLAHIEEYGVPVWDTATIYVDGSLALGSDEILYESIQAANQGNDPTSSPSWWTKAFIDTTTTETITGTKTFDALKLGANMDANNKKIVTLATPTSNQDAANKAYVDGKGLVQAISNLDSESNAIIKDHAYLAQVDGFVYAEDDLNSVTNISLQGFIDSTNDPAGAGTRVGFQEHTTGSATPSFHSIYFAVPAGWYFEVIASGNPIIRWQSKDTDSKPIDQD